MDTANVSVDNGVVELNGDSGGGDDNDEPVSPSVHEHLELALEAAREEEMPTSELMGLFFYYAHSIAESYRQDVIQQQPNQ